MRIVAAALFCLASLHAQPGVCWVGGAASGCPCLGTQSPCVQTFIANATTAFNTLLNGVASLPQPGIATGLNMATASSTFRNADAVGCQTGTNTCIFSTALPGANSQGLIAYLKALPSSITAIDYNYDLMYYLEASQCAGCPTPAHVSWESYQLAVDDCWILGVGTGCSPSVKSLGRKLRVAVAPLFNTFTTCNSSYTQGSVTVAEVTGCQNQIIAASVAHWIAGGLTPSDITIIHEPSGYSNIVFGQTFDPADFTSIASSGCAAVHAVSGASGINCGAGYTSSDADSYVTQYLANVTGANFVGFDVYWTNGNWVTTMNNFATLCGDALAAGFACKANESDPPRHVPSGGGGGEQEAYEGCSWETGTQGWHSFGLDAIYAQMVRWAAAVGFSYWTRFSSQPYVAFDANSAVNCYSNSLSPASGASAYAMANATGTGTKSAITWNGLTRFGGMSAQGYSKTTGHGH